MDGAQRCPNSNNVYKKMADTVKKPRKPKAKLSAPTTTHATFGKLAAINESSSDVDLELRRRESEFYRLLRRVLVAQRNGDFDPSTKLEAMLGRPDGAETNEGFDSRMERALIRMPNS